MIKEVTSFRLILDSRRGYEYAHRPRFAALICVFEKHNNPGTFDARESQNAVVVSVVALKESAGDLAMFK